MTGASFKELMNRAAETAELDIEGAKIDFALGLSRLLERGGLTKADLAKRLGVSKPLVTRILRGDANLTIETMVRAARAAEGCLHLHVAPAGQAVRWFELIRAHQPRAIAARHPESFSGTHRWNNAANDHEAQPLAA